MKFIFLREDSSGKPTNDFKLFWLQITNCFWREGIAVESPQLEQNYFEKKPGEDLERIARPFSGHALKKVLSIE